MFFIEVETDLLPQFRQDLFESYEKLQDWSEDNKISDLIQMSTEYSLVPKS